MNSGLCGILGLVNGTQTVAASRINENWNSVQGDFYEFLMEMIIAVMVKNRANGEEGSGSRFW